MRSHCSLYVDVGYLLASAATRVTGTSLRNGIHVDYGALIEGLIEQAQEISGLPILRVHWYDSARDGLPDDQQQRIGMLPKDRKSVVEGKRVERGVGRVVREVREDR